jgi:hypothetical protein
VHCAFVGVGYCGVKARTCDFRGWRIPRLSLTSRAMKDIALPLSSDRHSPTSASSSRKGRALFRNGLTIVGLCAMTYGCGGPSQEASTPLAPLPPSSSTPLSDASEPVVVAAEPSDLIVVGRARTPAATLTKLGEWAGFPLPWEEFLAQRLPRLAPVVRTDLPVDFAVSLDPDSKGMPELYAVFSVALSDYDKGLAALRESGEVLATEDVRQVYVEVDEGIECNVARAPSHVRLVCGKHVALNTLGPFVATNLSQQQVGNSDLYTEVRLAPIYARYGKKAQALKVLVPALLREGSLQNARFDAALAAAAHATVDDLLVLARELDSVRLNVELQEPAQQAVVSLDVRFRGAESFIPAAIAHAATNTGAVPEVFWTLPADSSTVSFSSFAKPFPRLVPVVDTLGELAAGALEHVGLASGIVDRWLAELKALLTAGGASVYAYVPSAEQPAKNLDQVLGVNVLGIEGDSGAAQRLAEASVTVFNDKRLRAEIAKRSQELKDIPTIAVKNASPALGLPAGSKAYSITLPKALASELAKARLSPEFADKQGAFSITALLVKQGERTWLGWGSNDAQVAAALKYTLAGGSTTGLAVNTELSRWRTAKVNSAASMRVAQLFAPSLFGGDDLVKPVDAEVAVRSMPNGGKGLVHISSSSVVEGGPQANLRIEIPKDALADLTSAIIALATAKQ